MFSFLLGNILLGNKEVHCFLNVYKLQQIITEQANPIDIIAEIVVEIHNVKCIETVCCMLACSLIHQQMPHQMVSTWSRRFNATMLDKLSSYNYVSCHFKLSVQVK